MRSLYLLTILMAGVPVAAKEQPAGYLNAQQIKGLLQLIPPPPEPGSPQDKLDQQRYRQSAAGAGSAAWQRASDQKSVNSAGYRQHLSCALGATVDPKSAPIVSAVLGRAMADAAPAYATAKDYFQRERPFTTDAGRTCDPDSARNNGVQLGYAYPSGHATTGVLWSLILADILPKRRAAALAFGKETGDLRVACRVHWQSDVVAGQQLGSKIYKLISVTPAYKADIAKARSELATSPMPRNC